MTQAKTDKYFYTKYTTPRELKSMSEASKMYYHAAKYSRTALFGTLLELEKETSNRHMELSDEEVIRKAKIHYKEYIEFKSMMEESIRG